METYLTRGDIADYLGVHPGTIRGYAAKGMLPEADIIVWGQASRQRVASFHY